MKKMGQWLLCVLGVEAVGILSGVFAGDIAATYANLNTPPFHPQEILLALYGLFYMD